MLAIDWINKITKFDNSIRNLFTRIYGTDPELLADRQKVYRTILTEFAARFGDKRDIVIVRSPARINLKGVHIEHRGGFVNYLTHRREILLVAAARPDDKFELSNLNPDLFPPRNFSIQNELDLGNWKDWWEYIASPSVEQQVSKLQGDWMNYIKGAVLRLQSRFPEQRVTGMDLCVLGDIPLAAGLSSSSALVVATTYAVLSLNQLKLDKPELVELCGQAEWYVGTRGGAGDHAAMVLGKRDYISHTQFFPLQIQYYHFPKGYRVVICNSFKKADKSDGVRGIFNSHVVAYELAFLLIKKNYPKYAPKLQYLRDINPMQLGVPESEIYRMLKSLPETLNRKEAYALFPKQKAYLNELFNSHNEPEEGYLVRDICLFGLAECERGKRCVDFLEKNDLKGFGELMNISHDGDRVVKYDKNNRKTIWDNLISIERLEELIGDLDSKKVRRVARARLYRQPGGYRCSCEELDFIVDTAIRVPGVLGAGLTGAGLGGCVLVLVKEQQVDKVLETLQQKYYAPRQLPFGAEVCVSVTGAGVVKL